MLRELDLFEKPGDGGFIEETEMGKRITFVVILVCGLANVSTVLWMLHTDFHRELLVNDVLSDGMALVNVSISVLVDVPCYFLHLDVGDSVGAQQLNVKSTVTFRRMDSMRRVHGIENRTEASYCGPCYGLRPDGMCCLTCAMLEELAAVKGVRAEREKWEQCNGSYPPRDIVYGEKCMVKGKITVNKVNGEFHIAVGVNNQNNETGIHSHFVRSETPNLAMNHSIERIRFGEKIPTASSPLVGVRKDKQSNVSTLHQYFLMVTPLVFYKNGVFVRAGFEYNAYISESSPGAPGLYFKYQFVPYTVAVQVRQLNILTAYANMCCFLAGVYVLASLAMLFV